MTKHDAIAQLQEIEKGDREAAHSQADTILLEFLASNGCEDLASAWMDVEKACDGFWYA